MTGAAAESALQTFRPSEAVRRLLARLRHLAGRRQGAAKFLLEAPRFEFHLVGWSVGVVAHSARAVHLLRGSIVGWFLAAWRSAFDPFLPLKDHLRHQLTPFLLRGELFHTSRAKRQVPSGWRLHTCI